MSSEDLPLLIAGPMLRHVAHNKISLWFITKETVIANAILKNSDLSVSNTEHHKWQVGEHCIIHTLECTLEDDALQDGTSYRYDLQLIANKQTFLASQLYEHLTYDAKPYFSFRFATKITNLIHGSCRKPHHPKKDSLPQLANLLAPNAPQDKRPDVVIFTGDQVYIDDVAGPMLSAIQQCIQLLGLYHEDIEGSTISHSQDLIGHPYSFYRRGELLPEVDTNEELEKVFLRAKKKPVFTSINADNHLIALSEMLALYILSWSSRMWPLINLDMPDLESAYKERYAHERNAIEQFKDGLTDVEKAFAHVPIYMIFDDHDITDDWNLTRAWEEQVYSNAFSRRIVGNALIAYFLCQGIGNPHYALAPIIEAAKSTFKDSALKNQDAFIEQLLEFDHWHYELETNPPIQVLDTRTQRWRSESNPEKPSGLMDWEALCELQQNVIGKQSVIMVSAAPIYGVKLIEALQRFFTTVGGALLVDAENWMAHRGTASVMLNIFRHLKTPPNFIILSGDVHYSFVYDVSLRFRHNSPRILQFTCSGIHNEFPDKLLRWFDRLNRFFYSHRSPLNFLTKRRNMSIHQREPVGFNGDLVNRCAMGLLQLNEDGTEKACKLILADGSTISFTKDQ